MKLLNLQHNKIYFKQSNNSKIKVAVKKVQPLVMRAVLEVFLWLNEGKNTCNLFKLVCIARDVAAERGQFCFFIQNNRGRDEKVETHIP